MKTLIEIPTRGDDMTIPGGIALRFHEGKGEFIVHNYSTDRETGTERHYWQGSYFGSALLDISLVDAMKEFTRRVEGASVYDTGGSIDIEALTA